MTWNCILLFVFAMGSLFATDVDFNDEGNFNLKKETLYISLGANCEMALRLRDCGLRHAAFPFDWTITKRHNLFLNLFIDDFRFFTSTEYFDTVIEVPCCAKNIYYELYFIHDWPFPDQWSDSFRFTEQVLGIQAKYDRRINRFRELKNYTGKIFFFRTFWFEEGNFVNAQQAQELRNVLDLYFPNVDFTLVIVNYTDSNSPIIQGIKGVLEFKIRREHNNQDFQTMINILNIQ
jgi:hypothetical protein